MGTPRKATRRIVLNLRIAAASTDFRSKLTRDLKGCPVVYGGDDLAGLDIARSDVLVVLLLQRLGAERIDVQRGSRGRGVRRLERDGLASSIGRYGRGQRDDIDVRGAGIRRLEGRAVALNLVNGGGVGLGRAVRDKRQAVAANVEIASRSVATTLFQGSVDPIGQVLIMGVMARGEDFGPSIAVLHPQG